MGECGNWSEKRRLFSGYLVLISCNGEGFITAAETMEGLTFLSKFKPKQEILGHTLAGMHIEDMLTILRGLEKKQQKRMKGYLQALDALELRLYPELHEVNHPELSKASGV